MRLVACAFVLTCGGALALWQGASGPTQSGQAYVNSIGIKMIPIPAGTFRMGNDEATPASALGQFQLLTNGDYDEKPTHEVRITRGFHISDTEITAEQFAQFRPDHQDTGAFAPAVTGISWHDAVQFADWLSRKEKRSYRLPTEAEWEYVARAGSKEWFSSGAKPPKDGEANSWGVRNMHSGVAEWVLDWHGMYSPQPQSDPVGAATGVGRVVRGGGIMGASHGRKTTAWDLPFYRRSANRASAPPEYSGAHAIGFRLVEAPMPDTPPVPVEPVAAEQFVKPAFAHVQAGPDPRKPWFRQRTFVPVPPENAPEEAIVASGIHPAVLGHLHSGALTVASNGDLIATWFASSTPATEYEANATFVVSRLRFGSDEWDFPGPLYDFADVNDQSTLLWNDNGTLWNFTGGIGLTRVPFRIQTSRDHGATWSPVRLPALLEPLGGYYPQPTNTAFRGPDGTIYFANDGIGGQSMLWASSDNGKTWYDTGGRTAGRHTVFAILKDGSILGIGGKNTNIDGYMPQAISRNGGKTWTVSKTPFPALGSNQRPTLVRLASGRLLFAGDWQERRGGKPQGITERGAFVALSDDEGKTWKMKTLPGTLPHESGVLPASRIDDWRRTFHMEGTLGYSVGAQGPNGVIHLVSSMNHPSQHWEMNEAWILSESKDQTPATALTGPALTERNGQASWSGRKDAAGRYVLDGPETWQYPTGGKQYEVTWRNGLKVGTETFWRKDGTKGWEWVRSSDGTAVWTQYWPNGKPKSRSTWRAMKADGPATSWNYDGTQRAQHVFKDGELIK